MGVEMGVVLTGPPMRILSKGYNRIKNVRKTNIMVAKVISEILKTMIGPKGMDKMLVTVTGNVIITNDGMVALDEMNVAHPVAKIIVEAAKTQDAIAGDGTKTVVILTGELLKMAEELLNQKIHPATIIKGYNEAAKQALEILDEVAIKVSIENKDILEKVAKTVMGGRLAEKAKEKLANLVVTAVKKCAEEKAGKITVDVDHVEFRKRAGGSVNDSELIEGLIIYKGKPHPMMPKMIANAKIALVECSLDPFTRKAWDWNKEYSIKNPEQLRGFIEKEKEFSKSIVKKVKGVGANVLFCRKRISDSIMTCFAEEGIIALNLTGEKDMIRLSRATGGKIVSNIDDLTEKDLGEAGVVEFRKIAEDEMLFIDRCKDPKALTMLIRGGVEQEAEELERIVKDGVKAVATVVEDGKVLPGGGAVEVEIARRLKGFSRMFKGREQLAIEAFAKAVEVIPKTLAANAGLNSVAVLIELRTGHAQGHANLGVNTIKGKVEDVMESGLMDAYRVKQHAIKAASEVTMAILKIDDVIAATKPKEIEKEIEEREQERQRITGEKVRELFARKDELKELEKFDKRLMERALHPETL
jgi:thermosome